MECRTVSLDNLDVWTICDTRWKLPLQFKAGSPRILGMIREETR